MKPISGADPNQPTVPIQPQKPLKPEDTKTQQAAHQTFTDRVFSAADTKLGKVILLLLSLNPLVPIAATIAHFVAKMAMGRHSQATKDQTEDEEETHPHSEFSLSMLVKQVLPGKTYKELQSYSIHELIEQIFPKEDAHHLFALFPVAEVAKDRLNPKQNRDRKELVSKIAFHLLRKTKELLEQIPDAILDVPLKVPLKPQTSKQELVKFAEHVLNTQNLFRKAIEEAGKDLNLPDEKERAKRDTWIFFQDVMQYLNRLQFFDPTEYEEIASWTYLTLQEVEKELLLEELEKQDGNDDKKEKDQETVANRFSSVSKATSASDSSRLSLESTDSLSESTISEVLPRYKPSPIGLQWVEKLTQSNENSKSERQELLDTYRNFLNRKFLKTVTNQDFPEQYADTPSENLGLFLKYIFITCSFHASTPQTKTQAQMAILDLAIDWASNPQYCNNDLAQPGVAFVFNELVRIAAAERQDNEEDEITFMTKILTLTNAITKTEPFY